MDLLDSFPLSGVLQLRQVTVLTANFIKPPTVGVAMEIVLVWSPATVTPSVSERAEV